MSAYLWKIEVQISQCQGIHHQPNAEYSLLLRLGDQFSTASPPGHLHSTSHKISFNCTIKLNLTSTTPELPYTELQIILVMSKKESSKAIMEEIIGMATVTIFYPLQEYLDGFKMFRFDKSLDSKGTVKARIKLQRQEEVSSPPKQHKKRSPTKLMARTFSRQNSQSSPSSSGEKPIMTPPRPKQNLHNRAMTADKSQKYKQTIEALTQERNQLYKMSEQLYAQLERCIEERDEYLRELREKVLSQEMMRAELEFLKIKVDEHEAKNQVSLSMSRSYDQLDDLRRYNEDMIHIIDDKDKTIKELERQVKESLVALSQFKREALAARSQLIHKESQLSMVSQQTKTLDPSECIQELYRELEERRYDNPLDFSQFIKEEGRLEGVYESMKKSLAAFFAKLLGRTKAVADKQWIIKQKVVLERQLEKHLVDLSRQQIK